MQCAPMPGPRGWPIHTLFPAATQAPPFFSKKEEVREEGREKKGVCGSFIVACHVIKIDSSVEFSLLR